MSKIPVTLNINDHLLARVERAAQKEGVSKETFIEQLITLQLQHVKLNEIFHTLVTRIQGYSPDTQFNLNEMVKKESTSGTMTRSLFKRLKPYLINRGIAKYNSSDYTFTRL